MPLFIQKILDKFNFLLEYRPSKYLIAILALCHFIIAYYFGVAWIFTIFFFYISLYNFIVYIIKIFIVKKSNLLIVNFRNLLFVLFFIELVLYCTLFIYHQKGIRKFFYVRNYKVEYLLPILKVLDINYINDVHIYGYPNEYSRTISNSEFSFIHHYDKYGFRNITRKSSYDCILLGDSFIEGNGASDSNTITEFLNNEHFFKNKNFYFFNAGVSGSNPIFSIKLYKDKIENFNFNIKYVLLSVSYNDLIDVNNIDKNIDIFEMCSLLYSLIKNNFLNNYNKSSLIKLKDEINDFNAYLASKDIKLLILYIPSFNSLLDNNLEFPYHSICKIDIDIFNKIISKLYNIKNDEAYLNTIYHYRDSHFNKKGYKIVADEIKRYFINNKID